MRSASRVVLALLFAPVTALGQIDPDSDGIGIYFDHDATLVSTTAAPGNDGIVSVTAYLVATHLAVQGEVSQWSASVGTTPRGVIPDCWSWVCGGPTAGFNYAENTPGSNHWSFAVLVDPTEHLPIDSAVVLATVVVSATCAGPVCLYVDYAELASLSGSTVTLNPSSGGWHLPVAIINGEAPVRAATATWSMVKRLYERAR